MIANQSERNMNANAPENFSMPASETDFMI
jgi:hypothetical protein